MGLVLGLRTSVFGYLMPQFDFHYRTKTKGQRPKAKDRRPKTHHLFTNVPFSRRIQHTIPQQATAFCLVSCRRWRTANVAADYFRSVGSGEQPQSHCCYDLSHLQQSLPSTPGAFILYCRSSVCSLRTLHWIVRGVHVRDFALSVTAANSNCGCSASQVAVCCGVSAGRGLQSRLFGHLGKHPHFQVVKWSASGRRFGLLHNAGHC